MIKECCEMEQSGASKPSPATNVGPLMGVITEMNGAVTDPKLFRPAARPRQSAARLAQKKRQKARLMMAMGICFFIAAGCGVAAVLVATHMGG